MPVSPVRPASIRNSWPINSATDYTTSPERQAGLERHLAGPQHGRLGPRRPGRRTITGSRARRDRRNAARLGRRRRRKDSLSGVGREKETGELQEPPEARPGIKVSSAPCRPYINVGQFLVKWMVALLDQKEN